jgi:hypothetical protein
MQTQTTGGKDEPKITPMWKPQWTLLFIFHILNISIRNDDAYKLKNLCSMSQSCHQYFNVHLHQNGRSYDLILQNISLFRLYQWVHPRVEVEQ